MRSTRYTKEFKEMVIEEIKQGADVAQVARKHEISPKTVYNWLNRAKHKDWENTDPSAKKTSSYVPTPQEFRQLETENERLKRLLGDKDLEIAILRDLLKKTTCGYRTK